VRQRRGAAARALPWRQPAATNYRSTYTRSSTFIAKQLEQLLSQRGVAAALLQENIWDEDLEHGPAADGEVSRMLHGTDPRLDAFHPQGTPRITNEHSQARLINVIAVCKREAQAPSSVLPHGTLVEHEGESDVEAWREQRVRVGSAVLIVVYVIKEDVEEVQPSGISGVDLGGDGVHEARVHTEKRDALGKVRKEVIDALAVGREALEVGVAPSAGAIVPSPKVPRPDEGLWNSVIRADEHQSGGQQQDPWSPFFGLGAAHASRSHHLRDIREFLDNVSKSLAEHSAVGFPTGFSISKTSKAVLSCACI
jgi:hypothetical protein